MTCRRIKKHLLLSLTIFFFVACGSDSSSGADTAETSEVKTIHGLGDCKGANEGVTKLVLSENTNYKCVSGDWKRIESPVKSSTSKASSSSTQRTESSSSSTHRAESSSSSFSLSVDIVQGVMVDSRDDREYLTVTIGEQTWMAENLNFDYQVDGESYGNNYYNEKTSCDVYGYDCETVYSGRRYTIGAAIDSAAIFSEDGKSCGYVTSCHTMCDSEGTCSLGDKVRGICPEGWHLPSNADWKKLVDAVGGESIAPFVLASKTWTHWSNYPEEELHDLTKFHAEPSWCVEGECSVHFWSATAAAVEGSDLGIYGLEPELLYDFFFTFIISRSYNRGSYDGFVSMTVFLWEGQKSSIRCIKD